ncbi:MAG: UDP-N-acetylglucosamine 2-epimerase (non-hydrolyzing) [Ignavibacteriaceae bacterium]|nr:UDP-N-acetylglucosamine 2-epimerase (non-hydrolyzing) [Ignavibacteriaceae bacterium]
MKKIAVIFGTRPDTIKLASIILELKKEKKFFKVITIATAQHRQMLDQVLNIFKITPDYDLNIMVPQQSLATLTKNTIGKLGEVLLKEHPDMVIVQGDTTTTFVGSLVAFYHQIPVGHVEAGLRTNDKANPFPEEINRRLTSVLTDLHFAPTDTAKKALLKENISAESIFVTGNTVIDALNISIKKNYKFTVPMLNEVISQRKKIILVTMHRRENWGKPMKGACNAVKRLAIQYPDFNFVFPVHLNPVVKEVVHNTLDNLKNVFLIAPLDYSDFVNFMSKTYLIITDSGGVQEEGPHFGIPILVLRKVTERPEAVKYGTVKLVGLDEDKIFRTSKRLIENKSAYKKMASAVNPYGDGLSAKRTVQILKNYFNISNSLIKEFIPHK